MAKCMQELREIIPIGYERMVNPICPRCRKSMLKSGMDGKQTVFVHPATDTRPIELTAAQWEKLFGENDGR